MSDELREKVVKYFCTAAEGKRWGCGEPKCWCYIQADGVVALARDETLEEAAKICDRGVDTEHPTVKGHIMKNFSPSSTLAAAIRALVKP